MPPIHMTAHERAALARLARTPVPAMEVEREHGEKLVSHGLAVKEAFRLKITTRGQLELLRQRFRGMPTQRTAHSSGHHFISRFERQLQKGFGADPVQIEKSDPETG